MLYERFLYYIKGGYCSFNGNSYIPCRDTSEPKAVKAVKIPYSMYFGNSSSSWGGGVSFLDYSTPGMALGVAYLITREQFEHVHEQEGKSSIWYNEARELPTIEGYKAITISNSSLRPLKEPGEPYKAVLYRGIKENFPDLRDEDIEEYLNTRNKFISGN